MLTLKPTDRYFDALLIDAERIEPYRYKSKPFIWVREDGEILACDYIIFDNFPIQMQSIDHTPVEDGVNVEMTFSGGPRLVAYKIAGSEEVRVG